MRQVAALVFPNVLDVSSTISHCNMLAFSRLTSVMLLGMYGIYLWFQLKTHTHLFQDEDGSAPPLPRSQSPPRRPSPAALRAFFRNKTVAPCTRGWAGE